MAVSIKELASPQLTKPLTDEEELHRQHEMFHDPFNLPEYTEDPRRLNILAVVKTKIKDIRDRGSGSAEFLDFQLTVIDNPDYIFLQQPYPGLNTNGWGVLLAMLDPLKFGRHIHSKTEGRIKTSGRR